MNLSLETLLHRLVGRGNIIAQQPSSGTGEAALTAVSLKPATQRFLQAQANALNTSVQGLVDLILDGVAEATTDDPSVRLRSIRERFFLLMKAHDLDLPAAVALMSPFGFTLSALSSDDKLLDLMTQAALEFLVDVFHVRSTWLRGAGEQIVSAGVAVRWYKNVPAMARQLVGHARAGLKPELIVIRREGADFARAVIDDESGNAVREPVGIVLRLHRSVPGGVHFDTYQMWEFERWNHWRCREQLKLLIAFCEQVYVSVVGYELPQEAIDDLLAGRALPVELLRHLGTTSWHPDNFASFRFEVTQEADEWETIASIYRKSSLPEIAEEAGASRLPDQPWRPGSPLSDHFP